MDYKIFDSVTKIDGRSWDKLFGDIPEGRGFFKTIEESGIKEFSLFYAVIYEGAEPALIAPLFITDFNLDIALGGWIRRMIVAARRVFPRLLKIKTLFCGSPFGENGVLGLSPELKDKLALILELARITDDQAKKHGAPLVIFKDFLQEHTLLLDILKKNGFFKTESLPSATLELKSGDFDGYLKSLSPGTRKNLLRKLKKCSGVEVKITDSPGEELKDIYRLYLNNYNSGDVKFEKLTPEFFAGISENLKGKAFFFLYYAEGKLAAFNLCFLSGDTLIDKFIGFDYPLAHKYNLYFFSWCYNVKWCLNNKIRYYQTGQTDYQPKLKLGGKLIPLFAYLKHRNPLMQKTLRRLAYLYGPGSSDQKHNSDA